MSERYLIKKFLALSRIQKSFLMKGFDYFTLLFVLIISFPIRLGYWPIISDEILYLSLVMPFIAILIFSRFGLYKEITRYIGFTSLWLVIKAITFYLSIFALFVFMLSIEGVPRSIFIISWLLSLLFIGGSRMFARWIFSAELAILKDYRLRKKVLIYGAGDAGLALARAIDFSKEYKLIGFLDDNLNLSKATISGFKIYDKSILQDKKFVNNIDEIFLAIPSLKS